jgi:hypothetical protein
MPLSTTTDPATSITNRRAVLHGTLNDDGGFPNVYCYFEWGEITYDYTTSLEKKVTGETFSSIITELKPNTTYYFRAVADNKATVYGSDEAFTTKKGAGNPNIDQLIFQHAERMAR